LVAKRIVDPLPSRPRRHDRSITVDEDSFRMAGAIIRVKVVAVNRLDNNGPPWRGGTRTGKTGLCW
jgi:hypothetical protein